MLSKFASLLFLGLGASALIVGCTAEADSEAADDGVIAATQVTPGTFKLYAERTPERNEACDVHTVLELSNTTSPRGARAALREGLIGACRIFVRPDERAYRLRFAGTACGSKIYTGETREGGVARSIKITDHRTRTCKDVVPATIVIEEIDASGASQTKYGDEAPSTSTWLTIAPRQCGNNAWAAAEPAADAPASILGGEEGEVDDFFRARGIALEHVGFAFAADDRGVCESCSCARGDTLVVKAKTSADAATLVAEYGFAPAAGMLTKSPRQCGINPWENGEQTADPRVESQRLAAWAASAGAPLIDGGFVSRTEPFAVCMACQCPRGDEAVVFPRDAAASRKLENLGWARVEN